MTDSTAASTIAVWEQAEIERANASGLTPVVFVHGLWLLSSSWQRWRDLFEASGYTTIAPGWPDDPATVQEAFAHPEVFAGKKVQGVTDHYLDAITQLDKKPAVIGHSFGGLIAQKIAGVGASATTVTIDNAPFRGVLPLPISSLRSAFPVLGNPANYGKAIALTFEQFKYGWANNLGDAEAKELYETFHVPAPAAPLFQAAVANFNPFSETRVDSKNSDRGPLLVIAGDGDHTIPSAISEATFKIQSKHNPGVTEIEHIPRPGPLSGHRQRMERGR
ncbi:MAG TPA: alpha/beta fold hydrolase [Mycobacterium sp.]|nr:alpha/beta fold hydrolase [Mycobacterium sp.]HUH72228.1 alpha/beta fold hydrolase [Mycobacterium sp.]